MKRSLAVGVLCLSLLPACGGCGGGKAPKGLVENVPEAAIGVVVINSKAAVEEFRALTPYSDHIDRWNAMGEDVDDYLEDTIGIGLTGAERAVIWTGEDGWGALVEGDFDGDVDGDTDKVGGIDVVEIANDTLLGIHDGDLIIGNEAGIEAMMGVIEDDDTSLDDSDDESAEQLVDMLGAVGGDTFAVAFLAEDLDIDDIPMPPVEVLGLGSSSEVLVARARFDDDDDAEDTAEALTNLIEVGMGELDDELDRLRDRGRDPTEVILAIMASHGVELAVEELLEIDTDGSDLVIELELPGMGATLPLVGISAAVAIPAFLRYISRSKTVEATMNVRRLYDSSVSYYDAEHATATGNIVPPQFPTSIPLTPAEIPCGEAVMPNARDWDHPGWEALNFSISDPHRYSYQYDSSGERIGSTFTASAFGDLDCDGVISTFVRVGEVEEGNYIRGGAGLYQQYELE